MAWGLKLESEKIFLFVGGSKAKDSDTMGEFGHIEHIDNGRTADELWVSLYNYI